MAASRLPFPVLDALPLGAHRLVALTDEALFAANGVRIMFTGRRGGTSEGEFASLNCGLSVGDDERAVRRNRQLICEAAGAPGIPLVVPRQVHGVDLVTVPDKDSVASACDRADEGADGVVVGCSDVAALLVFADCLPLIIVSPSGRFAVVHAGWRGAVAGIAGKAARQLARIDPCPVGEFNAYVGPHIRSECFEVGADVAARFCEAFGSSIVEDGRHVSLVRAVGEDLARAGIDRRRIADSGVCTKCRSDQYYSHRATGGSCGRHAAFAVKGRSHGSSSRKESS